MYQNGNLTREGMIKIINEGGSVLHKGKTFTKIDQIPSNVQLASDSKSLDEAEAELDRQEAEIATRRKQLEARKEKLSLGKPLEETTQQETESDDSSEEKQHEEEPTFGDESIPLSEFKGKTVKEILDEEHKGIGKRTAERIVKLLDGETSSDEDEDEEDDD